MPPTLVQTKTGTIEGLKQATGTLPNDTVKCNSLILSIAVLGGVTQQATVTDSQGNAWASILKTDNGAGATLETFLATDIVGGPATMTVSFPHAIGRFCLVAAEYGGLPPTLSPLSIVDEKVGAFGDSGNPSAGAVTTAQDEELIYSVAAILGAATLTPGSDYNAATIDRFTSDSALQITRAGLDAAPGTYVDGWTGNAGFSWLAQTISFVETSGATAVPDAYLDGGEDAGSIWDLSQAQDSSNGFKTGEFWTEPGSGSSSGGVSNTLRCQFNAGDFALPEGASITGLFITFEAAATPGMFDVPPTVSLVKVGDNELSAGATIPLTEGGAPLSFTTFSYGGVCDNLGQSDPNAAWEIGLRFTSTDESSGGQVTVKNVTATVYYYTPSSG